ncbi:MAG TPA: copper resistance protein NlpE, partial [Thermomonas sp.]|nr:copper resistance protein NlpE [Thermomonas sp.]
FDAKAFAGTYGGTLPCADCPGIDTSVAFAAEGGYSMSETYQDGTASSFVTKGTWAVREDGKTVLLDPEDKEERDRWFEVVSPSELRALDRDGKAIESTLDYSLRRK